MDHVVEHVVAFPAVLLHRVLLAVGPQTDAVPQVVHVVDVIHPVPVDDGKQHDPFKFPHVDADLGQQSLPLGVEVVRVLLQPLDQLVGLVHLLDLLGVLVQRAGLQTELFQIFLRVGYTPVEAAFAGEVQPGRGLDQLVDHGVNGGADVAAHEDLLALAVDLLALLVHHVIVFQNALADGKVPALNAFLRRFDLLGQHARLQRLIFFQTQPLDHGRNALGTEEPHHVVFQTDEELCAARVALTTGAASQLVVDTAALVALRTNDVQAAQRHDLFMLRVGFPFKGSKGFLIGFAGFQNLRRNVLIVADGFHDDLFRDAILTQLAPGQKIRVAAQQNVRAAARHVGGDGDRAHVTGLGHDLGFLLMVLGVQHFVRHAPQPDEMRKKLAGLHVDRAHQNGLTRLVARHDLLHHGVELALFGLVDHVVHILADHGAVGGDLHHVQIVDALELFFLRLGRAGHAGDLLVHAEVVLEGDGGQRLAFPLHLHVFLGLDGLMQTVGITAAHHQTAGELVHDDDFTVLHHVVHVPLHEGMGLQRGQNVVVKLAVFHVGDVFHLEEGLSLGHALVGEGDGLFLFGHGVVLFVFQPGDELIRPCVQLGGLVALPGNDKGRAGFVDEDGVHLVHDGVGVAPLHHIAFPDDHIVAQVIEAHFVVGAVGHVAGVGLPALGVVHVVDDDANAHAHEAENVAHPFALKLGQIVVDGDDMDALPGQGVQVGGQGGGVGLALAGLHFGDAALMQTDAAHDLHGEQPLAVHPPDCLPEGRECVGQDLIHGFALVQPFFQKGSLLLQLLV